MHEPALGQTVDLTQYGSRSADDGSVRFRDRPRAEIDEQEVSLLGGRLLPDEADRLVAPRSYPNPRAGVRHTTVATLEGAGFRVRRSPSARIPNHVSVEWPETWDDDVAMKFDECFGPPQWR